MPVITMKNCEKCGAALKQNQTHYCSESSSNALLYGGAYNFKNQPERLKYIGQHRGWYQFEKVGEAGVWCELLDSDLHMIEETDDFNKEENDDFNYEHDHDVGN